jgi:Flp pilus assembly pilin Flp
MKKLANVSPILRTAREFAKDTRGATMVEYALMLFLILVCAALAVRTLGTTVSSHINTTTNSFAP